MPDVSREQAHSALLRMGYELIAEEGGFAMYRDRVNPGEPERPLKFDFSRGAVPRLDFQRQLEHEGVSPEVFFAEVESL